MAGNARSSILVIEDDAHIRRMMQLLLEGEGYAVTVAASAAAGTLRARSAAPSLVLLDLGLPDASGMDLLSAEGALGGAPVIVVTAHGQEADKVRALDAGADDYVVKPFSNAELLARVRAALRQIGDRRFRVQVLPERAAHPAHTRPFSCGWTRFFP